MSDSPLRIHFDLPPAIKGPIQHTWDELAFRFKMSYEVLEDDRDAHITIGKENGNSLAISSAFCQFVEDLESTWSLPFSNQPLFRCENGLPDYLGTAFYMMQGLQEYDPSAQDVMGRYDPTRSYQAAFDCFEDNLVDTYFKAIVDALPNAGAKLEKDIPSRVYLSQDIDMIHASLRQETWAAIRQLKPIESVRVVQSHLMGQPTYLNMKDIMDLQSKHGYTSTFFWLPINKATVIGGATEVKNADYDLQANNIRQAVQGVLDRAFTIGLHKGVSSSSFNEEMALFDWPIVANRNHYLVFRIPEHYRTLSRSKIELDFSLGFSKKMGFRNSYGLPFLPYDLSAQRVCDVLEVPLHIMDASFMYEKNARLPAIEESLLRFISEHRNNCIISILWHNNTFSKIKYPHFRDLYERVLKHLSDLNIENISLPELLEWKQERMAGVSSN